MCWKPAEREGRGDKWDEERNGWPERVIPCSWYGGREKVKGKRKGSGFCAVYMKRQRKKMGERGEEIE